MRRIVAAVLMGGLFSMGPALAQDAEHPFDFLEGMADIEFMDRIAELNAATVRTRGTAGLFDRTANGVVLIADASGGQGTGVVISRSAGLIVTNWHVIHNARRLGVFFKPPSGLSVEPPSMFLSEIVRVNQSADLAILRVSGIPDHVIELPLGDLEGWGLNRNGRPDKLTRIA